MPSESEGFPDDAIDMGYLSLPADIQDAAQGIARPPWSAEQVASLSAFQAGGFMHPFTCPREHIHGPSPILEATPGCWRCSAMESNVAWCGYFQDWAHAFMADWSWKPNADAARKMLALPADSAPGTVTVGDVRAMLARHGVPHSDETHYAVAAAAPGHPLAVLCCCDGLDHVTTLMGAALEQVTGQAQVTAGSDRVIVSREDLRLTLEHVTSGAVSPVHREAIDRLRAAAGEQQ